MGDGCRKFRVSRRGFLAEDPRRRHVYFDYLGQRLIGEVRDVSVGLHGSERLIVRHFCGDPWPVAPLAILVRVIG